MPPVLQVERWIRELPGGADRLARLAAAERSLRAQGLKQDVPVLEAIAAWRLRQQLRL